MQKTFKTIEEQIIILRDKGLIIDDEEFAKETLLRENYFFISGYRHLFMDGIRSKQFKKNTMEAFETSVVGVTKWEGVL